MSGTRRARVFTASSGEPSPLCLRLRNPGIPTGHSACHLRRKEAYIAARALHVRADLRNPNTRTRASIKSDREWGGERGGGGRQIGALAFILEIISAICQAARKLPAVTHGRGPAAYIPAYTMTR